MKRKPDIQSDSKSRKADYQARSHKTRKARWRTYMCTVYMYAHILDFYICIYVFMYTYIIYIYTCIYVCTCLWTSMLIWPLCVQVQVSGSYPSNIPSYPVSPGLRSLDFCKHRAKIFDVLPTFERALLLLLLITSGSPVLGQLLC